MRFFSRTCSLVSRLRAAATLTVLAAAATGADAGVWTKITNNPPSAINLMLLLPDGTVMCSGNNGSTISKTWFRLTPDIHGSYINGTWTSLSSMINTRLYYPSQVLRDGRVFVAGGEYGTGGPFAEIYDPTTNVWTALAIPASLWNPATDDFYDCNSEILPDGSVLLMPVFPHTSGRAIKYTPSTNTWSSGGTLFRGTYQDEATWVKLPDNTILTLDPFGHNTYGNNPSERYNPVTNTWINDGVCPVNMYDPFGFELGGGVMLPNGKAFFVGSLPNTALYTPSGTTAPGTWAAGPIIPGNHGVPDGPCAMMVNGKVLCAVSPVATSGNHFPSPTTFYEYDYVTNAFTSITGPTGASDPIACYQACMLCLPDGSVMYSHMSNTAYIYTPSGSPLPAGKPVITSVTPNGDGSYHLTGTGLNGISEGASYGDDFQMNTNYPLVRLTSGANVYYARTFNWSSTSFMTGAQVLSTEFRPPASLPAGQYSLYAVGNGFASDPVPFCTTPLAINSQPSSVNVCSGASATFTVGATGTGPITYQWRRGTTNLTNGGHFSGVTTATLTVNPATAADTGTNYNCVVTHGCGSLTSSNATLALHSCCPADFNGDTSVDDFDFFDFLNAFNANNNSADFNGDTSVDDFDFFDFLNAFSIPC
ncbi:MAG: immunoglobulin domain-containing protein [Phycisphaerae bacterium]|nr:immunoglobulin domain-containing protein [Phycisphaerae bacterium]